MSLGISVVVSGCSLTERGGTAFQADALPPVDEVGHGLGGLPNVARRTACPVAMKPTLRGRVCSFVDDGGGPDIGGKQLVRIGGARYLEVERSIQLDRSDRNSIYPANQYERLGRTSR